MANAKNNRRQAKQYLKSSPSAGQRSPPPVSCGVVRGELFARAVVRRGDIENLTHVAGDQGRNENTGNQSSSSNKFITPIFVSQAYPALVISALLRAAPGGSRRAVRTRERVASHNNSRDGGIGGGACRCRRIINAIR